jgi:hypothetical protein
MTENGYSPTSVLRRVTLQHRGFIHLLHKNSLFCSTLFGATITILGSPLSEYQRKIAKNRTYQVHSGIVISEHAKRDHNFTEEDTMRAYRVSNAA